MYLMILKVVTLFQLMACNQNLENDSNPPHEVAQDGIFEITQLTSGLVSLWGMTFLPDQSILIGSRTTAQIHRINETEATSQLVGTVPNVSFTAEGGLLELEVSPKFEEDRLIYAYSSSSPSNRIFSLKIAEDFRSLQVIDTLLEGITTANRHHGGRLLIDSNDCMWITTGDAFQLDVSKVDSIEDTIKEITNHLQEKEGNPNFDILVNNAGLCVYAPITQTSENDLDLMYAVHVKAPFLLSQKAFPFLNDGGSIINLSSGLTRFSNDGYAAYASMKGAIDTLTKYMAKEFSAKKIRVNVIAPGAIETDFGGGVRDNQELNAMIANQTALGRVGLPEDIGSVVAFLVSDEAKWINAQRIEVSGGIHI